MAAKNPASSEDTSKSPESRLYAAVISDLKRFGRTDRRADLEQALEKTESAVWAPHLANLLTHCCFAERDFGAALKACRKWLELAPKDASAHDSLLSILTRLKRYEEVVDESRRRLAQEPENSRVYSSLTNALARLNRADEARDAGNTCLWLKDRAVGQPEHSPPLAGIPDFDPGNRERNLIAFSLFGDAPTYCDGAVRNAIAAQHLYPEWLCRFFVDDSVPARVTERLQREGATVRRVTDLPAGRFGTFWRFLVADDPGMDRYLIRDCDACLNLRERAAVDAWIRSNRHFHVMRDGLTHTEVMLAGMWGGVRGSLPPIKPLIVDYCRTAPLSRTADQAFLREIIWPTVRQSVLTHDSEFSLRDSQPFPTQHVPPAPRVGQSVSELAIHWPA